MGNNARRRSDSKHNPCADESYQATVNTSEEWYRYNCPYKCPPGKPEGRRHTPPFCPKQFTSWSYGSYKADATKWAATIG